MSSNENNAEIPSSMKRLPTHLLSIIMQGGLKLIWVKTNRQIKTFSVLNKNEFNDSLFESVQCDPVLRLKQASFFHQCPGKIPNIIRVIKVISQKLSVKAPTSCTPPDCPPLRRNKLNAGCHKIQVNEVNFQSHS